MRDAFQQPVMYLVRHGSTELNAENRYRGFWDVSLDEQGRAAADEAARFLSYTLIGPVTCSDLARACETAAAISGQFDRNPNLRPWNIGSFAGQLRDSKTEAKLQFYLDHPDRAVPQGESINTFRDRFNAAFQYGVLAAEQDEYPHVWVTHTSNIIAAKGFIESAESIAPETSDVVEPGGIVAVYRDGDTFVMEPVLGGIEQEAGHAS